MRAGRVAAPVAMLVVVASAALGVVSSPAVASGAERITSFTVDADIAPDASVRITETIVYDFGGQQRRGIIRVIPISTPVDSGTDRVVRISDLQVTSPTGAPTQVQEETTDGALRVRVGDPDVFLTGTQTYVVSYRVVGAMTAFDAEGRDEFVWNATGLDWTVPIERAAMTVSAPGSIAAVACTAGPAGSQLPCTAATSSGERARAVQSDVLPPGSGLTVAVALPAGVVSVPAPLLEPRRTLARSFSVTPWTVGLALLVLLAGVAGVLRLAWTQGRDRRYVGQVPGLEPPPGVEGTVETLPPFASAEGPVEFAPPPDVRPGIVGTLVDERANVLDVTATVVDLAVRGYVRIEEVAREGWFGKGDWRFVPLRAPDEELLPYERRLLTAITSRTDSRLSVVAKEAAAELEQVQKDLYNEVLARGWFRGRPDDVRTQWAFLGGMLAAAGGGLTWLLARFTTFGLVGLGVVLAGLVLLVLSRWMPARTPRGSAVLARTLGFRRYLRTAEAEQIRFEEREQVFSRYLPYAMVFGEAERWARTFAAAGFGAAAAAGTGAVVGGPGVPLVLPWYVGAGALSMDDFSSQLSAFSVTTAGSIAAASAAAGGSAFGGGGGGFSGGGFGGGGGGSW